MNEKDILKYNSSTDTSAFNTTRLTKQNQQTVIFYIGEFRNFPFRKNKFLDGWYPRDGKLYDLNSRVGKVLNLLDEYYKFDWGIKVINGKINIPNAFEKNGWGIFERPVNGNNRQVGSFQDDAIRNITSVVTTGSRKLDNPRDNIFVT